MPLDPETPEKRLQRALRVLDLEVGRLLRDREQGRAADLQMAAELVQRAWGERSQATGGCFVPGCEQHGTPAAAPPDRASARRQRMQPGGLVPLRDFERVAYGFIASEPASMLRDRTWRAQPQRAFRATGVLVWVASEREGVRPFEAASVVIESMLFAGVEQLEGGRGVPAAAFRAPITPGLFLRLYLEEPRNQPQPIEHLIGERNKTTPLDTAPSWIQFPAVPAGAPIEVRFSGALVGLVVVGHQLL